jgi:norsolorinic acid ketoreductase
VIAGVRNPSASEDLSSIKSAKGSKLITVKIESTSTTDAKDAAELLKSKYGLSHIDVVIANAGISTCWATALNTPPAEFQNHLNVNATGTLILFQAVHELLSASKDPKFVTVGTPVGSASELEKFPLASTSYGSSKAALHFLTRKLHFEHPDMVIFPIAPG